MNNTELKRREWKQIIAMPKALIILGLAVAGHLASAEVTLDTLDCSSLHWVVSFFYSHATDQYCLLQQFTIGFLLHVAWLKNYFMSHLTY